MKTKSQKLHLTEARVLNKHSNPGGKTRYAAKQLDMLDVLAQDHPNYKKYQEIMAQIDAVENEWNKLYMDATDPELYPLGKIDPELKTQLNNLADRRHDLYKQADQYMQQIMKDARQNGDIVFETEDDDEWVVSMKNLNNRLADKRAHDYRLTGVQDHTEDALKRYAAEKERKRKKLLKQAQNRNLFNYDETYDISGFASEFDKLYEQLTSLNEEVESSTADWCGETVELHYDGIDIPVSEEVTRYTKTSGEMSDYGDTGETTVTVHGNIPYWTYFHTVTEDDMEKYIMRHINDFSKEQLAAWDANPEDGWPGSKVIIPNDKFTEFLCDQHEKDAIDDARENYSDTDVEWEDE